MTRPTSHRPTRHTTQQSGKWVDAAQTRRRIDEGNKNLRGNATEGVEVENGGNVLGLERENEVVPEAVVVRITGAAD